MADPSQSTPLFTIPYTCSTSTTTKGTIQVVQLEIANLRSPTYLLTINSEKDNRLIAPFWSAFITALDILQYRYPWGVLITTSAIPKFYSNGLDLEHIMQTPGFFEESCLPGVRRVLTFPMPTIALINGHAFGGGVFLAMAHDYRVMNPSKGFMCLPEVDLGMLIPYPIQCMFKEKTTKLAYRTMALEGTRVPGPACLQLGVVDVLGGLPETIDLIQKRNLSTRSAMRVWGGLKEDLYKETLDAMDNYTTLTEWRTNLEIKKAEIARAKVDELKTFDAKAKL